MGESTGCKVRYVRELNGILVHSRQGRKGVWALRDLAAAFVGRGSSPGCRRRSTSEGVELWTSCAGGSEVEVSSRASTARWQLKGRVGWVRARDPRLRGGYSEVGTRAFGRQREVHAGRGMSSGFELKRSSAQGLKQLTAAHLELKAAETDSARRVCGLRGFTSFTDHICCPLPKKRPSAARPLSTSTAAPTRIVGCLPPSTNLSTSLHPQRTTSSRCLGSPLPSRCSTGSSTLQHEPSPLLERS